jgi:ABC-type transporter Mla subunit MlaD
MNVSDPQFWMMISSIIIAICFIAMAAALIWIALIVRKVIGTVDRLEEKVNPLIIQVNQISEQGKEISVQFNEMSGNLSKATKYFADSAGLIKEEVKELKLLVGETADTAKDKVALVSQTIDRTQTQVTTTADFIQDKVVQPAAEIAAIMAGVRKGLEVLFAPSPKQIDRAYQDDEMFIG